MHTKPPPLVNFLLVFKLATTEAPPPLSATTITTGPPAEGIHLVMHLSEEAILGGPVYMRWIDYWRHRHSYKDRNFILEKIKRSNILQAIFFRIVATLIYGNQVLLAEMKGIQDAIATKTIPPNTDREILDEVLKSINRVHTVGVVRLLVEEQRKASECQQNVLKKLVDIFNRQQGNPSLQLQIPDLYTLQLFPCSISTPVRPSSTSPATSSTALDLGNCYTPTFDAETSQSGEQDDNGSDDGNHEYDVDIYDDE
nr:hypothetical protein [Tanacetum cinerariifolium]